MRRERRSWVARNREGAGQRGAGIVLVTLLSGGATPAFAQAGGARPSPPPVFPTGVELVKVDVVVLGKAEQPVTGLSRDDFTILEEGVARPIQSFEAITPAPAEPPAEGSTAALLRRRVSVNTGPAEPKDSPHFLFLFDSHRLSLDGARRAAKNVRQFLVQSAAPSDWVTLASTLGSLTWTGRLRDIQDLLTQTNLGGTQQAAPLPSPTTVKDESAEMERLERPPNAGTARAKRSPDVRQLADLLALDPVTLAHECRPDT